MNKNFAGTMAAAALAAMLLAAPAFAAAKIGDPAPNFKAKASLAGKDFSFTLKTVLRKGPVVLYFYPSAFTKGCDLEAHTFAADKGQFDEAGATILGVSADSLKRLNAFSSDPNYCAGKFPVASDADGSIAASYGLKVSAARPGLTDVRGTEIGHGFIPRTTFVIGQDGRIVATFSSDADHLSPMEHVIKSLEVVRRLKAAKKS
ncbi:MAG TPA: peroxiredoxin [bacterium]|nr:peroxiredoxin [bacterium]